MTATAVGTARELLAELERRDIRLWREGERLRFDAPAGGFPASLRKAVGRQRQALLELVPTHPPVARAAESRPGAVAPDEGPLSFAQERLWFLHQLDPSSPAYHVPVLLELSGDLDSTALGTAVTTVASAHSALSTVFAVDGRGTARQRVRTSRRARLPMIDLGALPERMATAEAERIVVRETARPFDLEQRPPLRWRLLRLTARRHRLHGVLHHLVSDGWSLGLLLGQIVAVYRNARSDGPISPLSPPTPGLTYLDHARRQRRSWTAGEMEPELAFWRQRLAGLPRLELPPREGPPTADGRLPVHWPAERAERLEALARRLGVTPFAVALAAFQALLGRLSHQLDFAVGTPVAGRTRADLEGLVGLLVNTLVLRADLAGRPGLAELSRRAAAGLLEAQEHQELPFERLVAELAPPREVEGTPLIQVLIALQPPLPSPSLPDLELRSLPLAPGAAQMDLLLALARTSDGYDGYLEHRGSRVSPAAARRWLAALEALLDAGLAHPDRPFDRLPLLTPIERQRLIVEARPLVGAPTAQGEGLWHRFAARAEATPEAPALSGAGMILTYGDLARRAGRLAAGLAAAGVRRGDRVGVLLEPTPAAVVAITAATAVGAAYVPIDPDYPPARRALLLEDAALSTLVVAAAGDSEPSQGPSGEGPSGEGPAGIPRLSLDPAGRWLDPPSPSPDEPPPAAPVPAEGDDLAYLIYTSGSTGRPKGVAVSHRQVLRLFDAASRPEAFGEGAFGADDVWSLCHSLSFDFSVWEMWGALLHGGRLVMVPHSVRRRPERLLDLLEREGVTVLSQTPSAFRLLQQALDGRLRPAPALRWIVFGGEALDPRGVRPWAERRGLHQPALINMYGITETTVHVTFRRLGAEDLASGGSPIGRPLPDLSVYLLDRWLEPVPDGVAGEIAVGGAGVARGYFERSRLTAERFIPDPYGAVAGARLYLSGDLARRRPDGVLEFLGRADKQVKIRGHRIEPGEIETALAALPGLATAAVVAIGEGGEARLATYYVPAPEGAPTADELRRSLERSLPAWMVPQLFMPLDELPLTAHGKLDRAALPVAQPGAGADYRAPASEAEQALATVWREVLGVERVGLDDSFFGLGGDSILMLRLRALAADRGLRVELDQVFRHPTLGEMAAAAGAANPEEPAALRPFTLLGESDRRRLESQEGALEDAYPATRLQQGMLFHGDLDPGAGVYHDVFSYHLEGPFSLPALAAAGQEMARRHPALRTGFDLGGFDEPLALIDRRVEVPVTVADLTALSPEAREVVIERRIAGELRRPFDPRQAPLWRLDAVRRGPDRFQLTLSFHHAILDGWSVATLSRELVELYLAALEQRPASPPVGDDQPARHAAAERRALDDPDSAAFWRLRLAATPPSPLPAEWRAAEERGGFEVAVPITVGDTGRLQAAARGLGVSLKSVLLAIHLRVLESLTGRARPWTGLVTHTRPDGEAADRSLGLFLNTLPLRGAGPAASWERRVLDTFGAEAELQPYRNFPLAEIRQMAGGAELFDTAFNYVHFHIFEGLSTGALRVVNGRFLERTDLPLLAHFYRPPEGDGLALTLKLDQARVGAERGRLIAALYGAAIADAAAALVAPTGTVGAVAELLPIAERESLVEWGSGGGPALPPERLEAQVAAIIRRSPVEWLAGDPADWPSRPAADGSVEGSRLAVLDAALELMPTGAVGELYVGGDAVAYGYHQRRALTAARFLPDPLAAFWDTPAGSRLYRTGDLARWLPDGRVEILDRAPRAADGKLDQRDPPAPSSDLAESAGTTPAVGALAASVAAVFAEVLELPAVGAGESFFRLGGHSLSAARAVARLRRRLGLELPLGEIFDHPTPVALARRLAALAPDAGPPLTRRPLGEPAPLSFAQERLWLLQRLTPDSAAYNMPLALQVPPPIGHRSLEKAMGRLVERHETLRSVIVDGDDGALMVPLRRPTVSLPRVDLSALPPALRRAAAERAARSPVAQPFELADAPALRSLYLDLGGEGTILLLVFHHSICDGWSLGLVARELAAACREDAEPPPLALGYGDYAAWQRRREEGGALAKPFAWWRRHLAEAQTEIELPVDRPHGAAVAGRAGWVPLTLDAATVTALRRLGHDRGATPFALLLAAFALLLGRSGAGRRVVVGTPEAGRSRPEFEDLVGCFVNTLPLCIDLGGVQGFGALAARVGEVVVDALGHAEVPFERLVAEIGGSRGAGREPLVQASFTFDAGDLRVGTGEAGWQAIPAGAPAAKFELELSLSAAQDGVVAGGFAYRRELFDRSTVERMAGAFVGLLQAALEDPGADLRGLPLLSEPERRELIRWSWGGPLEESGDTWLTARLASWWLQDGDAVAWAGGGWSRTRLAREVRARVERMRSAGVGAESVVAVDVERSPELVAWLLAVVTVGGAYLPLDGRQPRARRRELVGVSGAGWLVAPAERWEAGDPAGVTRLEPSVAEADGSGEERGCEPVPVPAEALAYVIYTSGSSGRPKGVMVSRGALGAYLARAADQYGEGGTWVVQTPVAYDLAVTGLWLPLLTGGRVVLAEDGTGAPLALPSHQPSTASAYAPASAASFGLSAPRRTASTPLSLLRPNSLQLQAPTPSRYEVGEKKGLDALVEPPEAVVPGPAEPVRWKLTPGQARLMGESYDPQAVASRRWELVVGGESLTTADVAWLAPGAAGSRVHNEYGPTEAVVGCTVASWPGEVLAAGSGSLPIGGPMAGCRAEVVDAGRGVGGERIPAGVAGELWVGGAGLARGYLGDARSTAEQFVPDPYGDAPGARLYRTGDRVLWRRQPNGDARLEYLGRLDDQLKVLGVRVEPGEVEAALAAEPEIAAAAVAGRARDGSGETALYAWAVAAEGVETEGEAGEGLAAELLSRLSARLPQGLVPGRLAFVPDLPLTPAGKVDRKKLPDPAPVVDSAGRPPRSGTETALAKIWTEVLELDQEPTAIADFFALGGHSLAASRVIARLRRDFGVELPLAAVFEAPRLAEQAAMIEQARDAAPPLPALEPLPAAARSRPQPLSFAQRRFWFLQRLETDSVAYTVPLAIEIEGPLDSPRLQRALTAVAGRQSVLRSRFFEADGEPMQVVEALAPVPLPRFDLRGLPAGSRLEVADRGARQLATRRFDLTGGPPFAAALWRLAPEGHLLVLTIHHIATDGWSTGILLGDLAAAYREAAHCDATYRDKATALAPLPLEVIDHAAWQRRTLQGRALEVRVERWRRRLAGAPERLELPTDRPRPARLADAGGYLPVRVTGTAANALRKLAAGLGATPFHGLLALWYAILARWTGEFDLPVGVPVAGRDRSELEGVVGPFVDTVVLRGDVAGDPSLEDLVTRVRDLALDAFADRDLPFELLVETLGVARSLAHAPVFQVAFAYHDLPAAAFEGGGLRFHRRSLATGAVQSDLGLSLAPTADGAFEGVVEYRSDLFDRASVARLAAAFERLTVAAVAQPDRPVLGAPALAPDERRRVLEEWAVGAPAQASRPMIEAFRAAARRRPDAVALVAAGGRGRIEYGALATRVEALAGRLRASGVGPEVRVAVPALRSPELVVSLLAVLAAGGAFVPVDPALPPRRRRSLLDSARPSLLLAGPAAAAAVGPWEGPVLDPASTADDSPPAATLPPVPEEAAAYVLFTSGSSGRPKGVVVSRGALARFVAAALRTYGLRPEDRVLQAASLSFDTSVEEVFVSLAAGCTLVLREEDAFASPARFCELCERSEITVLDLPTAWWHELSAALAAGEAQFPRSVRLTILGGEAALGEALARWHKAVPTGVRLINSYGPTETTVMVTTADLAAADLITADLAAGDQITADLTAGPSGRVPIGSPIPGVSAYVLDRRGELAMVGAAGELVIAGGTLARGYLDAPGATAEAFRPDPFSGRFGARLYRTGDRARLAPNGQLEMLGRLDRQIKLRGFRIEPGEIEAVLATCTGVRAAVVAPRETAAGPALAAWLATSRPLEEVVASAAERLPGPMRPALWATVERFETTSSGKVDLRRLPPPAPLVVSARWEGDRPVEEEALAVLWQQVLGGDPPGSEDDFFALGGHSLLAARLIPRVREAFGVEMPLSDLFEAPTLRAQAMRLGERLRRPLRPSPPPLASADDRSRLSAAQRAIWFVDRLDPGSPAYGIPSAIRLEGDLDLAALRSAWSALAERHEVLRTRFPEEDGEPVARPLAAPAPESWPLVDLAALAPPAADREARRLAGNEARYRFDLAGRAPLRVLLLRHGARRWDLLVNVHHIAADGTSMAILFGDLQRLYTDLAAGRRPALEALPLQYGDYAAWESRWLEQPTVAGPLLESWRSRLGGELPSLPLPSEGPRQDAAGAPRQDGGAVPLALPQERLSPLLAAAAGRGATPFVALLAAWKLYLAQLTGERDLRVGTPVSVRPARAVEEVVGLFTNTVVLRTSLDGDPSFLDTVDRVRGTAIAAWAARELPYERLVAALRQDRGTGTVPLYEVWFVLQDEAPRFTVPGLSAEPLIADGTPPTKFDLALNLTLHDDALSGFVEHDPTRISETTARRLAAGYIDLLSAIAAGPDRPLSDLAARISEDERAVGAARRRGFEDALRSGLGARRKTVAPKLSLPTPEEPTS